MAALIPAVKFLQRHRFPKILAVAIPYFSIFILIFALIVPLFQMFIPQVQSFITGLPVYLNKSASLFGVEIDPKQIQNYISGEFSNFGRNALAVTGVVFGGLFSTFTVLFVSFYFLMYHDAFKRWVAKLFHETTQDHVVEVLQEIDDKLGSWLRGQLVLCFAIGFATWVALTLLGMEYALPLAVIAGILEILPTLGPTLSAVPAVIVALTISPALALSVVIAFIIIQQFENSFLVPKVMQRAVGLNPVIVIISIMIGGNLMGVMGALLAIPFVSLLFVLFRGYTSTEKAS